MFEIYELQYPLEAVTLYNHMYLTNDQVSRVSQQMLALWNLIA